MKVGAVATPLALVVAVAVVWLLGNDPLAPPAAGFTVNVTIVPAPTGLPPESFTVACKAATAVLTTTVCGVPLVAVTDAALPTLFVNEKVAELAPVTEAVTV